MNGGVIQKAAYPSYKDSTELELGTTYFFIATATDESENESESSSETSATFHVALYTLTGRILVDGSGLSGVSVYITSTDIDNTTTTDSSGTYTFNSLPVSNIRLQFILHRITGL